MGAIIVYIGLIIVSIMMYINAATSLGKKKNVNGKQEIHINIESIGNVNIGMQSTDESDLKKENEMLKEQLEEMEKNDWRKF